MIGLAYDLAALVFYAIGGGFAALCVGFRKKKAPFIVFAVFASVFFTMGCLVAGGADAGSPIDRLSAEISSVSDQLREACEVFIDRDEQDSIPTFCEILTDADEITDATVNEPVGTTTAVTEQETVTGTTVPETATADIAAETTEEQTEVPTDEATAESGTALSETGISEDPTEVPEGVGTTVSEPATSDETTTDEAPAAPEAADEIPSETADPEPVTLYYSTNGLDSVKNGDSGVYAYKRDGVSGDMYYIIDIDEGYAYFFTDGKSSVCERIKIVSGDLNDGVTLTYHDDGRSWSNTLRFKNGGVPDELVMIDGGGAEYAYYAASLREALEIKDSKTVRDF